MSWSKDDIARIIIAGGRAQGISDRGIIIGISVGLVESNLTVYGNAKVPGSLALPHDAVGSDGMSVGVQQQQVVMGNGWWWGPVEVCQDPVSSTKLFFERLKKLDYNGPNSPGSYGQAVQGSSFPDRYDQRIAEATAIFARLGNPSTVVTPPPAVPQTYGMPTGSNSGGYGGGGVKFPDWVYALGNAFGVKPSTYPGHQESDRNEGGYAPNPQHLNRGIDWAAPGASDEVDRMQRFADYLFSVRSELEQVIWWNPNTNKRIGVAGGKDVTTTPYYDYPGGYDDHRDHVHTRQSHPIPLPGGVGTVTTPAVPVALRPDFVELDYYSSKKVGQGFSVRSRTPINFFIHTEQGNSDAKGLANYCDGSHDVSYHYSVRDGIVCDIVDTDYYSWSVLSANVFSINLCFAGSYAEWTRAQWLLREKDIEIAAYLAVQDCHKYGIPATVISPPYHEAAGISDHKYVTEQLHIGTHVDVGNQFPWDVFTNYVNKYANTTTSGDDMAAVPQDQWDRVYRELTQRLPSRSPLRWLDQKAHYPDGLVDTMAGFELNIDGMTHVQYVRELAILGHQPTIDLLNEVASADPGNYPDRQEDASLARNILAAARKAWATPASTAVSAPAVEAVNNDYRIQALEAENASLRAQLADATMQAAQAQAQVHAASSITTAIAIPDQSNDTYTQTTGDHVARVVDSVENWTDAAVGLNVKQRAALASSIDVLKAVTNGSEPS